MSLKRLPKCNIVEQVAGRPSLLRSNLFCTIGTTSMSRVHDAVMKAVIVREPQEIFVCPLYVTPQSEEQKPAHFTLLCVGPKSC